MADELKIELSIAGLEQSLAAVQKQFSAISLSINKAVGKIGSAKIDSAQGKDSTAVVGTLNTVNQSIIKGFASISGKIDHLIQSQGKVGTSGTSGTSGMSIGRAGITSGIVGVAGGIQASKLIGGGLEHESTGAPFSKSLNNTDAAIENATATIKTFSGTTKNADTAIKTFSGNIKSSTLRKAHLMDVKRFLTESVKVSPAPSPADELAKKAAKGLAASLKDSLKDSMKAYLAKIGAGISKVGAKIAEMWAKFDAKGKAVWSKIGGYAGAIWGKIGAKAGEMWAKFGAKAGAMWAKFGAKAGAIWGKIGAKAGAIWGKIGDGIGKAGGYAGAVLGKIGAGIAKTGAGAMLGKIGAGIAKVGAKVGFVLGKIGAGISKVGGYAGAAIAASVVAVVEAAKLAIKWVKKITVAMYKAGKWTIKVTMIGIRAIKTSFNWIKRQGAKVWRPLVSFGKSAARNLVSAFKWAGSKITSAIGGAFSSIARIAKYAIGAALAAIAGLVYGAKKAADAADTITNVSQSLNMDTQTVQSYGQLGIGSGFSSDKMYDSLARFQQAVGQAEQKVGPFFKSMKDLKLGDDFFKKSSKEQLEDFQDALHNIPSSALQASIATQIFGKQAYDVGNVMAQGSQEIAKQRRELEKYGGTMSFSVINALTKGRNAIALLGRSGRSFFAGFGAGMATVFVPVMNEMMGTLETTSSTLEMAGKSIALFYVEAFQVVTRDILPGLISTVEKLYPIFSEVTSFIGGQLGALSGIATQAFSNFLVIGFNFATNFKKIFGQLGEVIVQTFKKTQMTAGSLVADTLNFFSGRTEDEQVEYKRMYMANLDTIVYGEMGARNKKEPGVILDDILKTLNKGTTPVDFANYTREAARIQKNIKDTMDKLTPANFEASKKALAAFNASLEKAKNKLLGADSNDETLRPLGDGVKDAKDKYVSRATGTGAILAYSTAFDLALQGSSAKSKTVEEKQLDEAKTQSKSLKDIFDALRNDGFSQSQIVQLVTF